MFSGLERFPGARDVVLSTLCEMLRSLFARFRWLSFCFLGLSLALTLVSALPTHASAQTRRVAVDTVRGPRGGRARSLLVSNLTDAGYEVVSDREIDGARDRLGISRRPSEEDWVSVARELGVIAIIDGRVSRARRSWRLTVRVRNGADGSILGDEGWGGRTTSAMDGVGRNGADRLRNYLDRASAPGALRHVVETTGETPWYAGGADGEMPEDPDEEEPAAPSDNERFDSFRISASAGTLWRSFGAVAEVYRARREPGVLDASTVEEDRRYQSGGIGHFELGIEAEFYPGALGDQPFPYLGIVVSLRNSVGLGSSACPYNMPCDERVAIGTNQTDVQAGARGRYRFGPSRRDFELMIEILYGYSAFTFDLDALQQIDRNAIIAPVEYQYVSLGGGFRYGIIPDFLNVALRADYRAGISVGAGARTVWGLDTGPPSGFLFGLDIIHEATWIAEGLFASLRLEYFQMITSFLGQVGCADPTASCDVMGDPWLDEGLWELWPVDGTIDNVVGGIRDAVSDHYFRWSLNIGYAFR